MVDIPERGNGVSVKCDLSHNVAAVVASIHSARGTIFRNGEQDSPAAEHGTEWHDSIDDERPRQSEDAARVVDVVGGAYFHRRDTQIDIGQALQIGAHDETREIGHPDKTSPAANNL